MRACHERPAGEELSQNRLNRAAPRAVGSAVRAAGGFPTQGGGSRADGVVSRGRVLARVGA